MATAHPSTARQKYVDFDEYIDFQLNRTRSNIKTTDILTALAGVATLLLGYLLVFVVLDHWVIEGGFSRPARWLMLGGLFAACTGWIVWRVILPYRRRVTGLYAARAIEAAEPELKEMLLTLVDLKRAGRPVPKEIERALEKRAAVTLSKTDVEAAVDRRPLLRLFYALLALVVIWCIYTLYSPKRISASIWRALFPAAQTAVDTIIKFDQLFVEQAGRRHDPNCTLPLHSKPAIVVDLQYSGDAPEEVVLYFTTADRRFRDRRVVFRRDPELKKRYRAILLGEYGRGILQDLSYRIEAGDAQAGPFTLRVMRPPVATVRQVHYVYPPYMQREPLTQPGGHIDTWEGTTVTVTAETDQPVTEAKLVFTATENTGKVVGEVPMQIAGGTKLSVTLRRELTLCEGSHPHFYHIRCAGKDGYTDPQPAIYGVTIRRDRPPEIELLDPRGNEIDVPANTQIFPLLYRAVDPDFAVRFVTLRMKITRKDNPAGPAAEQSEFLFNEKPRKVVQRTYDWPLGFHQLRPGDSVEFWLEAQDTLPPRSLIPPWCRAEPEKAAKLNRKESRHVTLRIVKPVEKDELQQRLDQQRRRQQQKQQQQGENGQNNPADRNAGRQPQRKQPAGNNPQQKDKQPADGQQQTGKNGSASGKTGNPQQQNNNTGSRTPQNSPDGTGKQTAQNSGTPGSKQQPAAGRRDGSQPPPKDIDDVTRRLLQQQQTQQQQNDTQPKQPSPQSPGNKTGRQQNQKSQQTGKQQPNGKQQGNPPTTAGKKPSSPINQQGDRKKPPQSSPDQKSPDQKSPDQKSGGNSSPDKSPSAGTTPDQTTGPSPRKKRNPQSNPSGKKSTAGDASGQKQPDKTTPQGKAGNKSKAGKGTGGKDPGTANRSQNPNGISKQPGAQAKEPKTPGKTSRQSDHPLNGKKERVDDDGKPAKKQKATGNETGKAEPNKDPNANPTPTKRPNQLQRKEGTEPVTKKRTGSGQPENGSPQNTSRQKKPAASDQSPSAKKTQPSGANGSQTSGKKTAGKKASGQQASGRNQTGKNNSTGQKTPTGQNHREKQPVGKKSPAGTTPQTPQKKPGGQTPQQNPSGRQSGKGQPAGRKTGSRKAGGQQSGNAAGQKRPAGGQDGNTPAGSGTTPRRKTGGTPLQKEPGGAGNRPGNAQGSPPPAAQRDEADLQFGKKAANLVLNRLEDRLRRGQLTPDDLKKLGFRSRQDALDYIQQARQRYNNARDSQTREFLKSLRYLKFQSQLQKRGGEKVRRQDVPGVGTGADDTIPPHLRRYYKAFRRSVAN